jgi:hypothetical protein
VTDESLAARAQTGWIGLPSSLFSFWRPGFWYTDSTEHAPVSVLSDNQMPVPAVDPRGLAGSGGGLGSSRWAQEAVVMPGPVMLGQRQVRQPRVAPKYLNAYGPGRYRSPNQNVFRG